jgi:hypothetical protein
MKKLTLNQCTNWASPLRNWWYSHHSGTTYWTGTDPRRMSLHFLKYNMYLKQVWKYSLFSQSISYISVNLLSSRRFALPMNVLLSLKSRSPSKTKPNTIRNLFIFLQQMPRKHIDLWIRGGFIMLWPEPESFVAPWSISG